jgi:site-specific DNA-methyltransferase (adenine-specific)
MGSGTTAKMAYHCQRHYLGFEISQDYIDIAHERLRQRSIFELAN